MKYPSSAATLAVLFLLASPLTQAAVRDVTMYKNQGCLCCDKWAQHLEKNGFRVKSVALDDVTPVKEKNHVPVALRSCHTAQIAGYVFEGHVPADLVSRVLKEKPKLAGLAAPGMPQSAPGMDLPGNHPYAVIAFTADGKTRVYAQR